MSARDRILERRAKFISTALVLAAGCSREQGASKVPGAEVRPAPAASAPADATPSVAAPGGPVRPPPGRPSLEVSVSAAGAPDKTAALARIDEVYRKVEALAGAVPAACPLGHAECKARFEKFADDLAVTRASMQRFIPPCPAKKADDKAIEALMTAHDRWFHQWLAAIEAAGRAAVADDAGTAWADLMRKADEAHPEPCLKYYCP